MSQILIRRRHGLDHAHARATAEKLAADLASGYRADYQWQGNEPRFRSPGIEGMLLQPFRGKIESGIRARLDAILP